MAGIQRTLSGKFQAFWRDAKGVRIVKNTDEFDRDIAAKKAQRMEAEFRFWEDHVEGVWQRLAGAGFSPQYMHSLFIGRASIRFPEFRALLLEASIQIQPASKWVDRKKPQRKKSQRTWMYQGERRTLDQLLEHADVSITRPALRARLSESKWDVEKALSTPLMTRSESGILGASIQNQPRYGRGIVT